MKKIITIFVAIALSTSMLKAQPISDMGVIPIGVTLNSILRLEIVSGGNIEFVVSTIAQYTAGIANLPVYDTNFTVSSSRNFDVDLYSENVDLVNVDGGANMPLDNIGYTITELGTGADGTQWDLAAGIQILDDTPAITIVDGIVGAGAGNSAQNDFVINWELATAAVIAANTTAETLLVQSLAGGRYITNVILVLTSKL
ncbi:MAG: hypothetical protein GY756_11895 [bacterium]|nr:hypothetical protein [bacterium]